MDPATVTAGAYGIETAVEAGVATYILTQPTLPLKARLHHISSPTTIPRSSHSLSVIGDQAYIFGGYSQDEKITSNNVLELHIDTTDNASTASLKTITAIGENGNVPRSRVDHTATVARNRVFVFGGRDASAIEENGRLWVFDPLDSKWIFLDPPPHTSFPCARYKHASTASEDGSAVFIHGGCAADGSLWKDTWAFYLDEGKWTRLGDAPGAGRSGASIACCKGKLWRFGGWDGERVIEGLDVLELPKPHSIELAGTLDDSRREWEVVSVEKEKPQARSMAALHYVTTGNGRDYLVLALGEGDAQPGEGKLLQDLWAYQLPSSGLSGAGVKDAIREKIPGVSSHEGEWAPVEVTRIEIGEDEKQGGTWTGRSFFGSSMTGTKQFMLWGGLNELGEGLGDGWWVKIE
ncbi:galactose oxidase [Mollisia scopiformis]|uniref:Galactose oxidase n=1 Tax=Mollisia scopiformis TaxID=149040 RepID=A0A194XDP3_MOLSC|nr:galactose oxidase [Mollisia scopiformis]KUJ17872.1 galactose oxidase [Mollisia scopiformis]